MNNDELLGALSRLTDEAITGLLQAIGDEVKMRTEARNAALPDDVWLTARQGHPSQVTRERANQLVEAGTHEIVTAPHGDEPTDLVWVRTKLGHVVQVTKERALELLGVGTHRLASPEETAWAALPDSVELIPNVDVQGTFRPAVVTKERALELLATGKYKLAE